ncbi:hypothetical protein SCALM49S_05451 [Streptomyces californicus]
MREFPPKPDAPAATAWSHWHMISTLRRMAPPPPGGAAPTAYAEPDAAWLVEAPWQAFTHQLSVLAPLAVPAAPSAVQRAAAGRTVDLARGFVRAVRRRDWLQAAGAGRSARRARRRTGHPRPGQRPRLRRADGRPRPPGGPARPRRPADGRGGRTVTTTATQEPSGRPGPGAGSGAALAVLPGVLRAALGWTDAHRARFALPDDVLEPHTQVNGTLKPLGELAQLGSTIQRTTAPGTPEHEVAGDLVAYAWEQVREGALLLELLRAEPFAAYPYEIYAAFAGYGLRHEGFEALARPLTATRAWAHTEQHANRQLGLVNSERRVGTPTHTDAGAVLSRTWLGGSRSRGCSRARPATR